MTNSLREISGKRETEMEEKLNSIKIQQFTTVVLKQSTGITKIKGEIK